MSRTTKQAIAATLKELLQKKPLDKITVSELAERCGINRMTFYYHFKDLYDLVEWCCLEDARAVLADSCAYDTWQQGFLRIFEAVQENKAFVMNVYYSMNREQMEQYLYRLMQMVMMSVVAEEAAGMCVTQEEQENIASFYKYAFVGIMLDWVRGNMQQNPEAIIDRLAKMLDGTMKLALQNAERQNNKL